MKLDVQSIAFTTAILWGLAVFLTGLANIIWPSYAVACLQMIASLYPGYHADGSFVDLIVGTLYALVDGLVCGLIFAWLYNLLLRKKVPSAT